MKVYVNRAYVKGPWGGGNGAYKALFDHMVSHDITCRGELPDTLFGLGLDREGSLGSVEQMIAYKTANHGTKLFLRVNDCDARKGTSDVDQRWLHASARAEGTIFVSQWMHDYFMEKGWACKKNTVIVNGVNGDFFRPKIAESNEVRPVSITTAHWSDNPMKGQDYVEWLDDFVGRYRERFTYTYIGRTKAQLKNSTYVPPLWGADLGNALASHDICVNASRWDPGPNSCIESIACGLPTYVHRDGGGGVEFAGSDHTFSTFNELEQILLAGNYQPNVFPLRTWEQFANDVFAFINEVSNG